MFNRKAKKFEALRQAIAADDPALADIGYFGGDKCYEAAHTAIRNNAPKVLAALVKTKSRGFSSAFAFADTREDSKRNARRLLATISAAADPLRLWTILHEANAAAQNEGVRLADRDFLTRAAPADFIQQQLERDPLLFKSCVENIGLAETEKLKFILTLTPKTGDAQIALSGALIKTAGAGDAEKTRLLLDHGADAHYAGGLALTRAVQNGHTPVAAMIRAAAAKAAPPQAATPAAAAAAALVENEALPGGGTLTTVFNFRTRQQHNVLATPDGTKLMTTVSFKDIDKDVIAAAQKRYEEQGRQGAADGLAAKSIVKKLKGAGLA